MDRLYATKCMLIYGCRSDASMIEDELGCDQQHRDAGAMRMMRKSNQYSPSKRSFVPLTIGHSGLRKGSTLYRGVKLVGLGVP